MEIKKGKLNYDQSGRAYPDNHNVMENWDCIWECNGKHYKLVGDFMHKEWEEVKVDPVLGDKTSLVAQTLDEIELKEPKRESIEDIKLEEVFGSQYCQFSVVENKLAMLYRNQEKLLKAIKLLNNGI